MFFSFGVFFFNWRGAIRKNRINNRPNYYKSNALLFILYFVSIASVTMTLIGVLLNNFSIADLMNISRLSAEYANKRYASEINSSVYSSLGNLFVYIVSLISGLVYSYQEKKYKVLFFTILPVLAIVVLKNSKGILFGSLIIIIAGIIVTRLMNGEYGVSLRRSLFKILLGVVGSMFLMIKMFEYRGLSDIYGDEFIAVIKYKFTSYSSGHLFAFSDWFSQRYGFEHLFYHEQEGYTYGFYTFMSVFRFFGDDRYVPLGYYDVYFSHRDVMTNIYTAFRGYLTDFGFFGSLIFSFCVGLFSHFVFYSLLSKKVNDIYIVLYVCILWISYQTYIISTLTWNALPLFFITSLFLLKLNRSISSNRGGY